MLQGVCSPFFPRLAEALAERGHAIDKVNYNGGDICNWLPKKADWFRGKVESAPGYYTSLFDERGTTDLVLFGDCRPVHRPAIVLAQQRNIRIHVFEEGYFRPHWITLERGGVNRYSSLPRDPAFYLDAAPRLPSYETGHPRPSPFSVRAFHDVMYHLGSIVNPIVFPHYETHALMTAPVEYLHYTRRAPRYRAHQRQDARAIEALVASGRAFDILPLQMNGDAQMRLHSRFEHVGQVIDEVMDSFARHAPADRVLVVKNHPLDPGDADHGARVRRRARELQLDGRVLHLETGELPPLLRRARGVVTVNSTVGGSAMLHGLPTLALGHAVYDLPGLTFQGSLDAFWQDGEPPSPTLYDAFRNVVIHTTQVDGGFYTNEEIGIAVRNCVPRLEAAQSPLEALL